MFFCPGVDSFKNFVTFEMPFGSFSGLFRASRIMSVHAVFVINILL